jgi:hypothetical protein
MPLDAEPPRYFCVNLALLFALNRVISGLFGIDLTRRLGPTRQTLVAPESKPRTEMFGTS